MTGQMVSRSKNTCRFPWGGDMTGKRGLCRIAAASARPGTVPAFLRATEATKSNPGSSSGCNSPGSLGRTPDSNHQSNLLSVLAGNGPGDPLR